VILHRFGRNTQALRDLSVRATLKDSELEGRPALGAEQLDRFPQQPALFLRQDLTFE
jgi:hypothetical protein